MKKTDRVGRRTNLVKPKKKPKIPSLPKKNLRKKNFDGKTKKSKFGLSVTVRIKPILNFKQYKFNSKNNHQLERKKLWDQNTISISSKRFNFCDSIIKPKDDQDVTYSKIMPSLLHSFGAGFDCCLLAYGQTGSGKTHTMFGKPGTLTTNSFLKCEEGIPPNYGLFPRTMINLLQQTSNERDSSSQVTLKASVVEVYFENIFDLLNRRKRLNFGSSAKTRILPYDKPGVTRKHDFSDYDRFGRSSRPKKVDTKAIREKFKFSGQKEIDLQTPLQIAKLVKLLENTRTSRSTDMNDRSSRSHCVVTVTMMKRKIKKIMKQRIEEETEGEEEENQNNYYIQKSKFIFVDLAGSERIKKSGAVGDRKSEACNVNSSLSALARTINALSSKQAYVPFRDSTLTMILKDSFGGSCMTHMIVTIAEDAQHGEESLCSLRFGERSAMIQNKVKKSKGVNVSQSIRHTERKIEEVESELFLLRSKGMAGGVNTVDFAPHVVQSWYRNKKMFDEAVDNVEKYKLRLVELKDSEEMMDRIKDKLELAEKVVFVQNGIVQRMIYSGLWKKPHPIFTSRKAELNDLKQKLKSLRLMTRSNNNSTHSKSKLIPKKNKTGKKKRRRRSRKPKCKHNKVL